MLYILLGRTSIHLNKSWYSIPFQQLQDWYSRERELPRNPPNRTCNSLFASTTASNRPFPLLKQQQQQQLISSWTLSFWGSKEININVKWISSLYFSLNQCTSKGTTSCCCYRCCYCYFFLLIMGFILNRSSNCLLRRCCSFSSRASFAAISSISLERSVDADIWEGLNTSTVRGTPLVAWWCSDREID